MSTQRSAPARPVSARGRAGPHQRHRTQAHEQQAGPCALVLPPERAPKPKEVPPTFEEWFNGRFWHEWVVGRKNKPTEQRSKRIIYEHHLADAFGPKHLDEIGVAEVAHFRAALIGEPTDAERAEHDAQEAHAAWCR